MKRGLFQEAVSNMVRAKSSPTESTDLILRRNHKMPVAGDGCCGCGKCSQVCPSGAIDTGAGWTVDIGKCIFCWECSKACPKYAITAEDAPDYATSRDGLKFGKDRPPVKDGTIDEGKRRTIGRSISVREIDSGSCGGCEVEVNSLSNRFYDFERFGVKIVASPRHADVLLITGPLTNNMYEAVKKAVAATPDPKVIIAMGTCAISGGLFSKGDVAGGGISGAADVDIYIPGCPPPPDKLLRVILNAFGLTEQR